MDSMEYCKRVIEGVNRCGSEVQVVLTPMQAWCLMSIVQGLARRPDVDYATRDFASKLEDYLLRQLERQVAELGPLARAGRDPQNNDAALRGGEVKLG